MDKPKQEGNEMKQAIIRNQNEGAAVQPPYDFQFLADLKAAVPAEARKWDGANKVWLIQPAYAEAAIKIASQYFSIVDGRNKSASEIEEAQIDAEIAAIQANQAFILKNEARIDEIIRDLDGKIARYSFRSTSSVKGGLCRDRALLAHSLDNARLRVESLAELQVRGLAAAVRYLNEAR